MLKKSGPKRQQTFAPSHALACACRYSRAKRCFALSASTPVLSFWLTASLPPTLRAYPDFSALLGSLMGVQEVPSVLSALNEFLCLLLKAETCPKTKTEAEA
jgi:hypothetical protein